ncbi:MAG: GTP cyclohydrolase I FolE [Parachlamydiaceae bacterium]
MNNPAPPLVDEEIIERARNTRFPSPLVSHLEKLSNADKIAAIAEKFRDIMEILGLDVADESLQYTPHRVAKMYVEEVFSGLDPETFPKVCLFEDRFQEEPIAGKPHSNMVFLKVNFNSFCEHHFVPMSGTASIAYIPNGKLFGFSTIPRIVRFFAKRPQVQERLTAQIADALSILSGSKDIAVSLHAQHQCMVIRATESENSYVVTNTLLGAFETDAALRKEFLEFFAK